jgi:hypothetical protein
MQRVALSLSRQLLRLTIRRSLRRILPEVFRDLDHTIPPALMSRVLPVVIDGLIVRAVSRRTGFSPTPAEVEAIAGLFDPRRAARPLNLRQR